MESNGKPEVRFQGFHGNWEQCTLGEVGGVIRESVNPQSEPDRKFIEYSMPSYDNNRSPEEVLGKSMQSTRLKISGDILLINKLNVRQKRIWLVNDAPDNAVASSEFMPYASTDIDLVFLEQLMLSDKSTKTLESISSGTSNSQKRITPSDFLKNQILIPSNRSEQIRIGMFFNQIDDTIILHQKELYLLKQTKKSFMQKMFPKEGEKVPEVRFPGFTGDWEQLRLKEIAPLQRGFDLPKSKIKKGPYPVIFSNGIGEWNDEYKVKGPGVVTGRSGSIGNVSFIEKNYWPHNTSLWVTDFHDNFPQFIFYLYQKVDLSKFGTGSGVPTLNRNDVHAQKVYIPSPKEQVKLAKFFKQLDETITLHQRELELLQLTKKAFLQKLFV
ncbi:MAG: restriction endonuclease subunit S [Enterococcus devriesei]|uniref:restriction endonuclease subunit S n=1 Tax=Enterococcus devriesei TaxID=319970 RepID=UPI003F93265F